MDTNLEDFEIFLKNKQQFLKDMLLVVHNELSKDNLQTQLDVVEDIIHHFNIIVKDEILN